MTYSNIMSPCLIHRLIPAELMASLWVTRSLMFLQRLKSIKKGPETISSITMNPKVVINRGLSIRNIPLMSRTVHLRISKLREPITLNSSWFVIGANWQVRIATLTRRKEVQLHQGALTSWRLVIEVKRIKNSVDNRKIRLKTHMRTMTKWVINPYNFNWWLL